MVLYDRESFDMRDGNPLELSGQRDTTVDYWNEIEARQPVLEEKFLQTEQVPFHTQKGVDLFNHSFPD